MYMRQICTAVKILIWHHLLWQVQWSQYIYLHSFILFLIRMFCVFHLTLSSRWQFRYHTRTIPELLKCMTMSKCLFCSRFNSVFVFVVPPCLLGWFDFFLLLCFFNVSQSKEFHIVLQIWGKKLKWTHHLVGKCDLNILGISFFFFRCCCSYLVTIESFNSWQGIFILSLSISYNVKSANIHTHTLFVLCCWRWWPWTVYDFDDGVEDNIDPNMTSDCVQFLNYYSISFFIYTGLLWIY